MSDPFDDEFDDADLEEIFKVSEVAENSFAATQLPKKQPGLHHLQILTKFFGHDTFRPLQWEIVSAIIESRRDVCAVMATGYGKSLCFQYPSVFLEGITFVVSPLISLMEDQVLALEIANIPACLLGTAQKNQTKVMENILQNEYRLIYITPEFATGAQGHDLLTQVAAKLNVVLVAIDEAHCISSWGHEFRSQYRQLGVFRQIFPEVPMIAVTATATPQVRSDIITSLKLRKPLSICSGFDRPNLYFEVHRKGQMGPMHDLRKAMIYDHGVYKFSGPTIIYCITRKQTEDLTQVLKSSGIECFPYHAGLPMSARKEAHELFVRDKIDAIVATIAFGMGIDKPDIRNVIHYGASKSIENYYQEVGRAGRDGLASTCLTFYANGDFSTLRHLQDLSNKKNQNSSSLETLEDYLNTRKCRRRFILEYFHDKVEEKETPRPECCDNCTNKLCGTRTYEGVNEEGLYDFSEDAYNCLKTISIFGVSYGMGIYVLFLKGSKSAKIKPHLQQNPLFGCGRHKSEDWWKDLMRLLIKEKYIGEVRKRGEGYGYTVLELTTKGRNILSKEEKILLEPTTTMLKSLKPTPNESSDWISVKSVRGAPKPSTSQEKQPKIVETEADIEERMVLYRKLLSERTDIASQLDCMPYMVASNAALMAIARIKPTNLLQLRQLNLDGMTEAKMQKFGQRFLEIINAESKGNSETKAPFARIMEKYPLPNATMNITVQATCSMFQSGLTVTEIGKKRGIIADTVVSHLTSGMKKGYPIRMVECGVSDEIRDVVIANYRKLCPKGFDASVRLKDLKEQCPPDVTYSQLRVVLAYLQVRCHLKQLGVAYEEFEDFSFSEVDVVQPPNDTQDKLDLFIKLCEEQNDTDLDSTIDLDDCEEPPAKKDKIEPDCDDLFAILDSPPRRFAS